MLNSYRTQSLFEPRVIEFDNKRAAKGPTPSIDVTEDIVEQTSDYIVRNTCSLSPSTAQMLTSSQ